MLPCQVVCTMVDDLPEGHQYEDFEITYEDRLNLKEIQRCLEENEYTEERDIRDHIDLLENLDSQITGALEIERRLARNNLTAKHDQATVQRLMRELMQKLIELDQEKAKHRKRAA